MPALPIPRREADSSPFWISYADLMTALVMLFMVVMSISMVAIASRTLVEKKTRETEVQEVMNELDQEARKRGLEVTINRGAHTIAFGDKARFAFDSYQLSSQAAEQLRAFVPVLLSVRHGELGERWLKRIHIEGYTDEKGTYLYNVNLSLQRAQAVVCALFAADLTPEQQRELRSLLIIDGAAATSMKATPEESRRVEVRLEFRQTGDDETALPAPEMTLGHCSLKLNPE